MSSDGGPSLSTIFVSPGSDVANALDNGPVTFDHHVDQDFDGDGTIGPVPEDGNGLFNVNFSIENQICFTAGTMISCPGGPRAIEELAAGDVVLTRDNGSQEIRWIGSSVRPAIANLAPIKFAKGAIGNNTELCLSPQHRILIDGWRAELLFREKSVLVPAVSLINDHTITRKTGGFVTYYHFLCDAHEIVRANGVSAETLYLGDMAKVALSPSARAEIAEIFPQIVNEAEPFKHAPARPILKRQEARLAI